MGDLKEVNLPEFVIPAMYRRIRAEIYKMDREIAWLDFINRVIFGEIVVMLSIIAVLVVLLVFLGVCCG